jgi:hypothetical protein
MDGKYPPNIRGKYGEVGSAWPRMPSNLPRSRVRPNKAKDEVTNTAPSWKNVILEMKTERRKFRGKNSLLEHHSPGRVSRTDKCQNGP